jgi:hypothetical protein
MQSETIAKVVELAEEHHSKAPETLFVCGTYTLGKFHIFLWMWPALGVWTTTKDEEEKFYS